MTDRNVDPAAAKILHRSVAHLTEKYTGVFFPEVIERCVAQCHTALARGARIHTHLAPMAVHAAENRLGALARARGSASSPVRQVLFVDHHDTGPAQLAAGLLAHHAGAAVVARSAGVDPGRAVDPFAVDVLAQHGTEPAGVVPRPVTEELVRAADWIITVGAPPLGDRLLEAVPARTRRRDWPVEGTLRGDQDPSLMAELDSRIQALWVEISASAAASR